MKDLGINWNFLGDEIHITITKRIEKSRWEKKKRIIITELESNIDVKVFDCKNQEENERRQYK